MNNKETLFCRKGLDGMWRLQDSNHRHIATFKTAIEAEQWCAANGYRCICTS